jgi:hypothetical protein
MRRSIKSFHGFSRYRNNLVVDTDLCEISRDVSNERIESYVLSLRSMVKRVNPRATVKIDRAVLSKSGSPVCKTCWKKGVIHFDSLDEFYKSVVLIALPFLPFSSCFIFFILILNCCPGHTVSRFLTRSITAAFFWLVILIPGTIERFHIDFLSMGRQYIFYAIRQI